MRETIKRVFVVAWMAWPSFGGVLLKDQSLLQMTAAEWKEWWQIVGWGGTAIWALQFVATGIANPITLIRTTEFRQK